MVASVLMVGRYSAPMVEAAPPSERHPFLVALGERVRLLRSRRGLTRRAVAEAAQVSQRPLANLESGTGNASILILLDVATALLRGDKPSVRIEGDVQLAAEVNWLIDHVRWDAEEDLARLVGDATAHTLAQWARSAIAALKKFSAQRRDATTSERAAS
jgi:transcriptional regulator with XRE-family HTH domain